MKERILYLIKQRLFFILLFVVFKILFLIYHGNGIALKDYADVILHGLAMDNTVAAYFCVIPTILTFISVFRNGPALYKIWRIYTGFAILMCTAMILPDMELYKYWGFRIDSSVLMYLQYPKEAFASVPLWQPLLGIVIWLGVAHYLNVFFFRFILHKEFKPVRNKKVLSAVTLFLFIPVMFLSIRGSVSASTMNVGRAYYSENMFLNHAAVNPAFSFLSSVFDQDKRSGFRSFTEEEFEHLFNPMKDREHGNTESVVKPNSNLVFVVLEGFSSSMIGALDSVYPSTPEIDSIAAEGLLFTNFYGNSYRTDRGLTSIMSAMPALPDVSWMKYPSKLSRLPSWIKSFEQEGYNTEMIYGGDIDFTNMRLYFNSLGFKKITSQEQFPKELRTASWGVHDEYTFDYLLESIRKDGDKPFVKMLLTLSSHEPYDVPYSKSDDRVLNSMLYTDSCIGHFIRELKKTPQWENTLVVFVADHATRYPGDMQNYDIQRYRIPFLWTGGALQQQGKISTIGSQTDIAKTMLCQFGLPSEYDFPLSKNLFDKESPKFGFFIYKNGYGVVRDSSGVAHDFDLKETIVKEGPGTDSLLTQGKVILQYLENELESR